MSIHRSEKREEMLANMSIRFLPDSSEQIEKSMERLGPVPGQWLEL